MRRGGSVVEAKLGGPRHSVWIVHLADYFFAPPKRAVRPSYTAHDLAVRSAYRGRLHLVVFTADELRRHRFGAQSRTGGKTPFTSTFVLAVLGHLHDCASHLGY